jgi:penicillin amidase
MAGSSIPGIPLILIGRTNDITWGATASVVDVTDMFKEDLTDDDHYLVEGQKLKLEKETYKIKVKGKDPVEYTVKKTHRGPLMSADLIKNA